MGIMKVSVVVMTYNHERFVRSALDSVIRQDTNFDFEVIITEDCSTDRTAEIIEDFRREYPDKVRLMVSKQNQNDNEVLTRAIESARGDYIALLDGDDFWTSSDKLQIQSDYLDEREECAICFHNVMVRYDDGDHLEHPFHQEDPSTHISAPKPRPVSTLDDIVRQNFIQTCSVVFRRGLFEEFPAWYRAFPLGDWPLHILNAEHGDIGYIDEIMATYRVHSGGLWSMNMSRYDSVDHIDGLIRAYHTINQHFNFRFEASIRKKLPYLHYRAARVLMETRQLKRARRHAVKGITYAAPRFGAPERKALGMVLKSFLRHPHS